jgi:hypothetical protein
MTRAGTPARRTLVCLAALAAALAPGCGGGGGAGPTPSAPVIQVAGTYPTAVTLGENTCGAVTVLPNPTVVAHTPGATRVTLTHAGTSYAGPLAADGAFSTDAVTVRDSAGTASTIRIAGRFSTTGFDAQVTVDVQPAAGAACRYVVRWVGTKDGAPNVLP